MIVGAVPELVVAEVEGLLSGEFLIGPDYQVDTAPGLRTQQVVNPRGVHRSSQSQTGPGLRARRLPAGPSCHPREEDSPAH